MSWFCIHTHPKKETVAQVNIQNQGFETFLPTLQIQTKKGTQTQPLFPSYIFVKFDPDNDIWFPLCHTKGVKKLFSIVTINRKEYSYIRPIPVPEHLITNLQTQINNPVKTKQSLIHPGAVVKITSGALGPVNGNHRVGICQWSKENRVALLMDIMNSKVEVIFSRDNVELTDVP